MNNEPSPIGLWPKLMRTLRDNLLVQFTLASTVIATAIILAVWVVLSGGFDSLLALTRAHDDAMQAGQMIMPTAAFSGDNIVSDAANLRVLTLFVVAGVLIVWQGWKTITRQQMEVNEPTCAWRMRRKGCRRFWTPRVKASAAWTSRAGPHSPTPRQRS